MEAICHGVDGIDDESHLGVLCIIVPERVPLWRGEKAGMGRMRRRNENWNSKGN